MCLAYTEEGRTQPILQASDVHPSAITLGLGLGLGPRTRMPEDVPPLSDTSDMLWAASKLIGRECASANLRFLECKKENPNPQACLEAGKGVTQCVHEVLKRVDASECNEVFIQWKDCLKQTRKKHFLPCRELQRSFEACFDGGQKANA
eukprot:356813_1